MTELSIRGLFAPVLQIVLAICRWMLAMRTNDPLFVWGSIGYLCGLFFAKDARRFLTGVFQDMMPFLGPQGRSARRDRKWLAVLKTALAHPRYREADRGMEVAQ